MEDKNQALFNSDSRTKNVVRISTVSTICSLAVTIMGFVYRTLFIHILSASYLGINGLFSNILQVLNMANLGIGTAIAFRFYEPVRNKDIQQVGRIMRFYRKVYLIIGLAIFTMGMCLFPFLHFLIKDTSEVPQDVNIYLVYFLYLMNQVLSYTYSYKQTILTADQRQDIRAFLQAATTLLQYVAQIVVLVVWRNYTASLFTNIFAMLFLNYLISVWVSRRYRPVFQVKENLPVEEQKRIFKDTGAVFCHRIGSTVLNSTDNIILSSFVGVTTTGYYSNYYMIYNSLSEILNKLLGSFTASLGNAHIDLDVNKRYDVFLKLYYINLLIDGLATVCLYNLIDGFISLWVGSSMLLDHFTVGVLCVQFFITSSRYITTSHIYGSGLFNRDILRPMIEAAINVVVSIIFVLTIGMAGIFIGTIVSMSLTSLWREPYLLHKYEFKTSSRPFWLLFIRYSVLTVILAALSTLIPIRVAGIGSWLLRAILTAFLYMLVMLLIQFKDERMKFFLQMLVKLIGRIKKKVKK